MNLIPRTRQVQDAHVPAPLLIAALQHPGALVSVLHLPPVTHRRPVQTRSRLVRLCLAYRDALRRRAGKLTEAA